MWHFLFRFGVISIINILAGFTITFAESVYVPTPQSSIISSPTSPNPSAQTQVVVPNVSPVPLPSTNGNGQQAASQTTITPNGSSNATSGTTNPGAATQVTNQPDGTQVTTQTVYCPQPSDLIKNGLFWGTATGGWKSYSESFDGSISRFIGAQWVGVNVGKMICIYKGNLSMSFPITIQNDTLSQAPSGGLWGTDLGGYQNCHSTNMWDCPFTVKSTAVNINQIYQSLDFFKGKPDPLANNNNT